MDAEAANAARARAAEVRREQRADEVGWKAEAGGAGTGDRKIETLQDLRDLAATLEGMNTDEERLNALAGIVSGRMITNYFAFLDKRRTEAQSENRKANREAHYMALLYAQLDAINMKIDGLEDARNYLLATGDVDGTMQKPYIQEAIKAWEKKHGRQFDPNDPDASDTLVTIIDDYLEVQHSNKDELKKQLSESRDLKTKITETDSIEERSRIVQSARSELVENIAGDKEASIEDQTSIDVAKGYGDHVEFLKNLREGKSVGPQSSDATPAFMDVPGRVSVASNVGTPPPFMQESYKEEYNKAANPEQSDAPKLEIVYAPVPDFMRNMS
ncbi:MAG: hypothetical protein HQ481_18115 [Alphaproteobacteria bacterium]|nr:hypothetical protein [Alphaproteobacteria bacterium]